MKADTFLDSASSKLAHSVEWAEGVLTATLASPQLDLKFKKYSEDTLAFYYSLSFVGTDLQNKETKNNDTKIFLSLFAKSVP